MKPTTDALVGSIATSGNSPHRPPLTLDNVVALHEGVICEDFEGEIVIVDVDGDKYHEAGVTGSRIIERLDKTKPVKELAAELKEIYDIELADCEDQVLEFLEHLRDQSLLHTIK